MAVVSRPTMRMTVRGVRVDLYRRLAVLGNQALERYLIEEESRGATEKR
jgi:hypothetical protein